MASHDPGLGPANEKARRAIQESEEHQHWADEEMPALIAHIHETANEVNRPPAPIGSRTDSGEAPPESRQPVLGPLLVLAAIVVVVFMALRGDSSDVAVVGQSCTPNADGSVHVQGELRNDGSSDEIAIVEFSLTLFGGETETTQPFGGYNVPGGQTSLVGEDINVPPGASWVDCAAEIKG